MPSSQNEFVRPERVETNTDPQINKRIHDATQMRVEHYARHPEQIESRLRQLDREWDVERALETGSSALSLFGLARAILGKRKWLLLPLVVQGFFLQHALQGWCPPLPVFRRLGFRTAREIESERHALLALRDEGTGGALQAAPQRRRTGARRASSQAAARD